MAEFWSPAGIRKGKRPIRGLIIGRNGGAEGTGGLDAMMGVTEFSFERWSSFTVTILRLWASEEEWGKSFWT